MNSPTARGNVIDDALLQFGASLVLKCLKTEEKSLGRCDSGTEYEAGIEKTSWKKRMACVNLADNPDAEKENL